MPILCTTSASTPCTSYNFCFISICHINKTIVLRPSKYAELWKMLLKYLWKMTGKHLKIGLHKRMENNI